MADSLQSSRGADDTAELRVDGSELLLDVEFLIARVRAIGSSAANTALLPLGLRVRAYAVLSLACGSVSPPQRDLAEFLQLDPSQVVSVIDELQRAGLVERTQDPRDRRVNMVTATELGRDTYARARTAVASARDHSLQKLTQEERETLTRLLTKAAF